MPPAIWTNCDWIGLYPAHAAVPDSNPRCYRWVSPKKLQEREFEWRAREGCNAPGAWELRYFHGRSTDCRLAVSRFNARMP